MSYTAIYILRNGDKSGNVPVYLRVSTSTKDRKECYTGIKILPKQWAGKSGKTNNRGIKSYIKGSTEKIRQQNIKLDRLLAKIQEKETELIQSNQYITAEELISSVKNKQSNNYLLSSALEKIVQSKNAKSTQKSAESHKKLVLEFMQDTYGVKDIDVKKLELKTYKSIAMKLGEWGEARKYTPAHIRKPIKLLKNALEYCVQAGEMDSDPTNGFVYKGKKHKTTSAPALTLKEFELVKQVSIDNISLDKVRDVFVLQCLTGLSYVDTFSLKIDDLVNGTNQRMWIVKKRQKTGSIAKIPLVSDAMSIIQKYEGWRNLKGGKRLLPISRSNSYYNKKLKELACLVGIDKQISTHSGRHTFSTLLRESGVTMENIASMLAHSNIKQTETYAQMTDKNLANEIDKLVERLKEGA